MSLNTPVMNAMAMMYERARASMSEADLEELTCLSELAVDEARRMGDVCSGIGCLIAYDGRTETGAGNFRDAGDVSSLLFALGHSFDMLAGMVHVGDRATYESRLRALTKQQHAEEGVQTGAQS